MRLSRRTLLKATAATGVATLAGEAGARGPVEPLPQAVGLLVDTTLCVGCRACQSACKAANGLPPDRVTVDGGEYDAPIDLNSRTKTIVKAAETPAGLAFAKQQCMHCVDPSCVSACMLGALHKEGQGNRTIPGERAGTGIVLWDKTTCTGCRYCQIACAFNVPKFEWFEPFPKIVKCELCRGRAVPGAAGPLAVANPACAEVCPRGAVKYGYRAELLAEAKRRLAGEPARYNGRVYGEREGGGTQVLYLAAAGVPFEALGLPRLPDRSAAQFSESVSHAPYLYGATPIALYAGLSLLVLRNKRREAAAAAGLQAVSHAEPAPIPEPIFAPPMRLLIALFAVSALFMAWRFVAGVGAVSNMTDGFTWGIWEPVNVVVFTGIGAGALGVGLLTYVLNRGEYHGLVRPAVLLGAICYTLGGSSIMVALGRYWNALLLPVVPFWNLRSALLEVAVCVLAYIIVLWLEVLPSILEGAAASRFPFWARVGRTVGPVLARVMPFVIALAVVLPVMHQSSLGGLMLIAETKVHPLWHTALLPALFLVSCLSMGYGSIVALTTILGMAWHRAADRALLARMSKVNAVLLFGYVGLRLGDIAFAGRWVHLGLDGYTALFALEMLLFTAPALLFLRPAVLSNRGKLFGAAVLAVAAGALYRVDTYLSVYRPGPGWAYFPSWGEMAVTVGMAALGIGLFVAISRIFPILQARVGAGAGSGHGRHAA